MGTLRWIPWAGLAAIVGGSTAIVMTPPFATAYFLAYPGFDATPFWLSSLEPRLHSALVFSSPREVYDTYGKIFNVVYMLFLPAVFALHHLHRASGRRMERRGFAVLVAGLLPAFVGVAGDYWANGIGFPITVLGLLLLMIGSTMYGVALLGSGVVPRWCAWSLVSCGAGAVAGGLLISHIPSGPTFPFAIAWVIVGSMLLLGKGRTPPHAAKTTTG